MNRQTIPFAYRAFVSYNKVDSRVAKALSKRLLEHGIDVSLDDWSLHAGDSITDFIAKGITQANLFLLIASVNSMKSRWVREELRIALTKRLTDPDFRLITVRIDDCVLHPFLRDYQWVEIKSPREMNRAISKILAAILQIDLKPTVKDIRSRFYLNSLRYAIRFSGNRGSTASVSEHYDLIPSRPLKSIKKHIYHSGGLVQKEFVPESPGLTGTISVLEKTTAMERVEISFDKTLVAGTTYRFVFRHEIKDNFFNDEEFVYYTVESPTKMLEFDLRFSAECRASRLYVYKRLGQEELLIGSTKSHRRIAFSHYLPSLFDTIVFRWAWIN